MEEIKMRFGGDLEDVTERLEVDLRTSAGLEGYRYGHTRGLKP